MLHLHHPVQLTRWSAARIPPLPDNRTFPPFEIQWKPGRWCPLDLPRWSTYTRHSCPGLRHLQLHQRRGIHRSGNQSWKWAHWNPSRCRHMCLPLPVTEEQSSQDRERTETQFLGYFRPISQHDRHTLDMKSLYIYPDIYLKQRAITVWFSN